MRDINIGKTLVQKRKEKQITQDELANYIGVSKASVSKWETGQSYPDIVFLPQLAAYFNISVDELLGYEPQMILKDIRVLYHRLSSDFVSKPFENVLDECHDVIKKYFSCFPLLSAMGLLFLNTAASVTDMEKKRDIIEEAKELFSKVSKESSDLELKKYALCCNALCCINLGSPEEALVLLKDINKPQLSHEGILSSAYQMTGNFDKAKETLQVGIYQGMTSILSLAPSYMMLFMDNQQVFEEVFQRTMDTIKTFQVEKLHPSPVMTFYIISAMGYVSFGNNEKAMDLLQSYTNLVLKTEFPLKLHGDSFFNYIEDWFKEKDFDIDPPRDERAIKKSMVDVVESEPTFQCLKEYPKFKVILQELGTILV